MIFGRALRGRLVRWPAVGRPRKSTIIVRVRQSPLSQILVSTLVLLDEQSLMQHLPSSRKRRRRRRGAAVAARTEHSVSRRSIFWVHYVSTSTLGHTVSSWRSPTRPLHGVTEWSAAPQIPPLVRSRAAAAAGRKRSAWCCCWRVPTEGTGGGGVDVPSGVLQWRWPLDEQPAGDGAPGSSIPLLRRVHAAAGRERTDAWGVAGGSSLCRGPAGGCRTCSLGVAVAIAAG